MNKNFGYILLFFCLLTNCPAFAQDSDDFDSNVNTTDKWQKWGPSSSSGWGLIGRLGFSIGGTTPLPIPGEIRKIESFNPNGLNFCVGLETYKMFCKRWGLRVGFYLGHEGFSTRARVKDYYTVYDEIDEATGQTNEVKGWYTGKNSTSVDAWVFLLPVTATFRISPRWNVSAGPYLMVNMSKNFEATISDGYLRKDDGNGPTGIKTDPGTTTTSLGDDMRRCGFGLTLGFDWKVMRHVGAFAKLDWGLTSIFPSGYETVSFKMYPIYGTIGAFYSF